MQDVGVPLPSRGGRVGVLEYCFTCLGIFLAIVLFPFGFICCFALRKRRCPNCGAVFS
ncbi:Brain protein I3 [Cricetulus griseus]|nr:Brain protein I3 [Cricetulus griseus]